MKMTRLRTAMPPCGPPSGPVSQPSHVPAACQQAGIMKAAPVQLLADVEDAHGRFA